MCAGMMNSLPKNRPFSKVEAMYCLQVDYDKGKTITISGYASLWKWHRNTVTSFLKKAGIEIIYPKITKEKQNQNGVLTPLKCVQIGVQITESNLYRSKKKSVQINFIDNKALPDACVQMPNEKCTDAKTEIVQIGVHYLSNSSNKVNSIQEEGYWAMFFSRNGSDELTGIEFFRSNEKKGWIDASGSLVDSKEGFAIKYIDYLKKKTAISKPHNGNGLTHLVPANRPPDQDLIEYFFLKKSDGDAAVKFFLQQDRIGWEGIQDWHSEADKFIQAGILSKK
jgi:hypothetical protein